MDLGQSLKRKLPGLPPAKRPPGRFRKQPDNDCSSLSNEDSSSAQASSIALPSEVEKVSTPSFPTRTGDITTRPKHMNLNKIPKVFKRLCYFYFNNVCTRPPFTCNRMHFVAESMMQKIETLEGDELIDAYKFAKEKPKLLQYTVSSFIDAFSKKLDVVQLIRCVGDILQINSCDKTPFIKKILLHLLHTGISFRAAVNEIIEVHGNQNSCLSDILLDIIFFQHKEEVCKNWELIQKLLTNRSELIDHGIIEEIMTICCKTNSPDRKNFIKKVFDDIIKSDAVNFNMINNSILQDFIVLLTSLNLEEEKRVLFNVMEIYRNSNTSVPTSSNLNLLNTTFNVSGFKEIGNETEHPNCQSTTLHDISTLLELNNLPKNSLTANLPNIDVLTNIPKNSSTTDKLQDTDLRIYNIPENHSAAANRKNADLHTAIVPENRSSTVNHQDTDFRIDNILENRSSTVNHQDTDFRIDNILENCSSTVNHQDTDFRINNILENCSSTVTLHDSDLRIDNVPENDSLRVSLQDVDLRRDNMIIHSSSTSTLQDVDLREENKISNTDLVKLKDYIHEGNDVSFIFFLSSFKHDSIDKQRLFVVKALTYFKEETPEKVCTFMCRILNGIELCYKVTLNSKKNYTPWQCETFHTTVDPDFLNLDSVQHYYLLFRYAPRQLPAVLMIFFLEQLHPNYMNDVGINNMLSMLSINTIGLLESEKLYKNASEILLKFYMHLESLKNTIWLINFHRHNYSECGKFLYFCKIFIKGYRVKEAWKILKQPELRLMHKIDMCTLHRKDPFDSMFRNFILEDLICVSLLMDTKFAKVVILNVLQHKDLMTTKMDIWKHFNKLLLNMLKSSEMYMEDLKILLKYILGGWYKNLEKPVLRKLLICLTSKISKIDALKLYNKCCKQNCYPHLQGSENALTLNSDMSLEEIDMTINTYLYKKAKNDFELTDLMFFINLPNAVTTNVSQSEMVSHCERTIQVMKKNICSVLAGGVSHTAAVNYAKTKDPFILIEAKDLENSYRRYQKNNDTRNRR